MHTEPGEIQYPLQVVFTQRMMHARYSPRALLQSINVPPKLHEAPTAIPSNRGVASTTQRNRRPPLAVSLDVDKAATVPAGGFVPNPQQKHGNRDHPPHEALTATPSGRGGFLPKPQQKHGNRDQPPARSLAMKQTVPIAAGVVMKSPRHRSLQCDRRSTAKLLKPKAKARPKRAEISGGNAGMRSPPRIFYC